MDVTTIAGIFAAVGLILLGQALEGGHVGSLLQATAALIVFGGTFGAVLVAFPRRDVGRALSQLKLVFAERKVDLGALSRELVEYAGVARRDGVLALEAKLPGIPDPFLRRALQLVVDGVDASVTRSTLEAAVDAEYEEHAVGAKVWEAAGGFAPTIGILGAVLGLIHVMENLSDPSKLGGGIAVAFVATVYGVGSANVLFLPFATKMKRKLGAERDRKTLITEGVLAIQEGINPRVLEEKLRAYSGEPPAERDAEPRRKAA
ncbi:MotA/TolQ/ExbB proton channel [Anaeromyxobacter dehalogenans 2CP-1]|uniref:MotA/TolQ/ExbB proton channel n=1 Tax=Anaeromyxobacter dehalogenans (strain ATCC BAA-258 / DSM 21875 / 2CP-1) TaxID=455488 RepID=B8JCG5_ANAD2|nr:flagellar motor protein [Anaeromyxobacter dehalogenans]ACL65905.1 MotA/TolQ/ExbB proton channel [Anaeromyxobacter dehalogenans 2CP-1]